MAVLADFILDLALAELDTDAEQLHILSAEPANYAAVAGLTLGNKTPPTVSAPTDRTPNGRKVTVSAVTDGMLTGTGTATHWALVDNTDSQLLATGALVVPQPVTAGNPFTLSAFDIGIPDAV
jgi:hypothetical protein